MEPEHDNYSPKIKGLLGGIPRRILICNVVIAAVILGAIIAVICLYEIPDGQGMTILRHIL